MKISRKFFRITMKTTSLSISAAAILISSAAAQANNVVVRRVQYPNYHPTTEMMGPQLKASSAITPEQLSAMGLLGADGKFVLPAQGYASATNGKPKFVSSSNRGGPVLQPVQLLPQPPQSTSNRPGTVSTTASATSSSATIVPMNYDDALWPFTTARVQLDAKAITSSAYPYRASGKLLVTYSGGSFWCSATMIKKGMIVTAAHCVSNYGKDFLPFFSFTYYPGLYEGKGAYGSAAGSSVAALGTWLEGRAKCLSPGVVCEDDIAVITLEPKAGKYIGTKTGWMAYGTNGWGFTDWGEGQVAQLGYPTALDAGEQMIRTDSKAEWQAIDTVSNLMSSLPAAGSDGGPWVANLGIPPVASQDLFPGYQPYPNVIVGVTSWWTYSDSSSPGISFEGASPFTSDNISLLVDFVCSLDPAPCDP